MRGNAYYPLFADLHGRRCVIVGGGLVAQRKATTLLSFGARVTVVSPQVTKRLAGFAHRGRLRWIRRRFQPRDLRGAWLVYGATDDDAVNRAVSRAATTARVFANVIDRTSLCSFIAPAIFRRGALTVAVSTAGASPALAKRLRSELGAHVGFEYASMARLLQQLRGIAKRRLPSPRERKRYFDTLVRGRVFALMRKGQRRQARQEALALLQRQ